MPISTKTNKKSLNHSVYSVAEDLEQLTSQQQQQRDNTATGDLPDVDEKQRASSKMKKESNHAHAEGTVRKTQPLLTKQPS